MIKCHKLFLFATATQRGYTLDEVMPCVVSQDGDQWTIDVEHPSYPMVSRLIESETSTLPPAPEHGPGTELKKLLARVGIVSTPDCSCNQVVADMNRWGADECEKPERMDYIVAAMRDNAAKRGLPFLDAAGRMLVRRAIKNARREASRVETQTATTEETAGGDSPPGT
jgi:hypothetical protein